MTKGVGFTSCGFVLSEPVSDFSGGKVGATAADATKWLNAYIWLQVLLPPYPGEQDKDK